MLKENKVCPRAVTVEDKVVFSLLQDTVVFLPPGTAVIVR